MFGFLLKIAVVAALVVGVGGYIMYKKPNLNLSQLHIPAKNELLSGIKNINTGDLTKQMSLALDNLVTHPDKNSPVVLGVKITNESLNTLVDVIQKMPPDQVNQLKTIICSPATSSGSK